MSGPRSFFPEGNGRSVSKRVCSRRNKGIGVKTTVITSAIFGVKTTVITSAIFAVGLKKKKKHEQVWSFSASKSSDVL